MNWKFWLRKKEKEPEPEGNVLTEMAEIMQVCQINGTKPILFVLRDDAMTELKKRSEGFTHGIFGAEFKEGLTTLKSVFGVPVGFSADLIGIDQRIVVWSIVNDEIKLFSSASVKALKNKKGD